MNSIILFFITLFGISLIFFLISYHNKSKVFYYISISIIDLLLFFICLYNIIFMFGVMFILLLISCIKSKVFYYTSISTLVLLLFILSLPNFSTHDSTRSRVSTVKSNMHKFQTMLEIYSIHWSGSYPKNVEILFQESNKRQYWKELENPFGTSLKAYDNLPNLQKSFTLASNIFIPGVVYYQPIIKNGKITKYFIYGANKKELIVDKGKVFTFTNQ